MQPWTDFNLEPVEDVGVRGFLHHPAEENGEGIVLTHGAGANCRSNLLISLASAFCDHGFHVLRFDLPFRQLRPTGPPIRGSASRDQRGIELVVKSMRKLVKGRVFAGGHSYGGRQTSMVAASNPSMADGLVLLSYPLHPPQKPDQLRTEHFPSLRTPSLFVHGSRDGFGTLEEISEATEAVAAPRELLPVVGAGHELLSKKNAEELPSRIVEAFVAFVGRQ